MHVAGGGFSAGLVGRRHFDLPFGVLGSPIFMELWLLVLGRGRVESNG